MAVECNGVGVWGFGSVGMTAKYLKVVLGGGSCIRGAGLHVRSWAQPGVIVKVWAASKGGLHAIAQAKPRYCQCLSVGSIQGRVCTP
eukprot:366505-Chlamydomonas_euryale.AAC.7